MTTFAAKAKSKGSGLATVVDAVISSVDGQGPEYNGNGGFKHGNKFGARAHTKGRLDAARRAHSASHAAVKQHAKARTLASPAGRTALSASAKAARDLQSARAAHGVAAKVDRAVAARVKRAADKNSGAATDRAHAKFEALKKGLGDGTHDAEAITTHVDRLAKGATKAELAEVARRSGVRHEAKTKKELSDALKNHALDHQQAAEEARKPAPTLRETVAAEGTHVPTGREPKVPVLKADDPHNARQFAALAGKLDTLLGGAGKHKEVGDLVGATEGAQARLKADFLDKDAVMVVVSHPDYRMLRTLKVGEDGQKVIHNDLFQVGSHAQGRGLGTTAFADQVQHARAAGFARIETEAAGEHGHPIYNGYYTWPRMGYDAPLTVSERSDLARKFPGAKNVSDLMGTPEGRAYWKEHGTGREMTFDLAPDSLSSRVHAAYLAERAARPATFAAGDDPVAPGDDAEGGDRPDFTPEEEAAMDAAWDKVAAGEAKS